MDSFVLFALADYIIFRFQPDLAEIRVLLWKVKAPPDSDACGKKQLSWQETAFAARDIIKALQRLEGHIKQQVE